MSEFIFKCAKRLIEQDSCTGHDHYSRQKLRKHIVLPPSFQKVADTRSRHIHFSQNNAREIKYHRQSQRFQYGREHAGQVYMHGDLPFCGAIALCDKPVLAANTLNRGGDTHQDDEYGREDPKRDLLSDADPQGENEHGQEDRFWDAEQEIEERLEYRAPILALCQEQADQHPRWYGDEKAGEYLQRCNADRLPSRGKTQ